jgi:hypothetical protein
MMTETTPSALSLSGSNLRIKRKGSRLKRHCGRFAR